SEGNNYYRLKMVDQDGRFTYSPEIKISVGNTIAKVTVFPNPVVDVLTLTIEAINTETMVCNLFNADGKLVTTKSFAVKKGSNKFSWNLAQMAKGNYFITSINNHFETIKIIRE
ncbi:MAG: T9SS type A sorting domain-containing protein, partial [Ginsengibacter sp.]